MKREIKNIQCEGSCEEHVGNVVRVAVWSDSWKRMEFNYCQKAIDEDLRRGFNVAILSNSEPNDERSVATKMP